MSNKENEEFITSGITFGVDDELLTEDVIKFVFECKQCVKLYSKKNKDYGNSFEKGMDIIGPAYGIGRLYDKINRLIELNKNGKTEIDEKIEDTLQDLACYSIMMLSYYTDIKEKEKAKISYE